MLKHIPQYHMLSDEEHLKLTRRLAKIEATYRHPERGPMMRRELDKIEEELRRRPEPAKA